MIQDIPVFIGKAQVGTGDGPGRVFLDSKGLIGSIRDIIHIIDGYRQGLGSGVTSIVRCPHGDVMAGIGLPVQKAAIGHGDIA